MQANGGEVTERLTALVNDMLPRGAAQAAPFHADQQLSEIGITSIKMVTLMLSVETAFDIMIPQHEITPENFHSLATIRSLVERILQGARPA